ncbi:MAG: cell division protein ZapA [Ignavibacteria bacterium]|nr:cell division protein ZapA [Ignavibacteria bacterium]
MGKIKVKILGNEYTLKGENESIIKSAVNEVEEQLKHIMEKYKDESIQTVFTLTAINIAEKLKLCEFKSKVDTNYLIDEIKKITLYLIENTST